MNKFFFKVYILAKYVNVYCYNYSNMYNSYYFHVYNEYMDAFYSMCATPAKAIMYLNHDVPMIQYLAETILPCKYPIEVVKFNKTDWLNE